jgi:hypothetical protein
MISSLRQAVNWSSSTPYSSAVSAIVGTNYGCPEAPNDESILGYPVDKNFPIGFVD